MSNKASGQGTRFIECFNGKVVVFICAQDRKNLAVLSNTLLKALAIGVAVFYAAIGCTFTRYATAKMDEASI